MENLFRAIQKEINRIIPKTKVVVGGLTEDAECIAISLIGGERGRYMDLNSVQNITIQIACKSANQLNAMQNSVKIEDVFDCGTFPVKNWSIIKIECYSKTRDLGKDNNNNYRYVAQYHFELEKKG